MPLSANLNAKADIASPTFTGAVTTGTGATAVAGSLAVAGNVGFYGTTPIAKPGATADIKASLAALGLITGGSPTPLNLDGATLTAGTVTTASGGLNLNGLLKTNGWQIQNTVTSPYIQLNAGDVTIENRGQITSVPLIVRGMTGQTGKLQEWQDQGYVVRASVSNAGAVAAASLALTGALTVAGTSTLTGATTVGSTAAADTTFSIATGTSNVNYLAWKHNAVDKWYDMSTATTRSVWDNTNGKQHLLMTAGAGAGGGTTAINSALTVAGTSALAGAVTVGGSSVTTSSLTLSRTAGGTVATMHEYITPDNSPSYYRIWGGRFTGENVGTTDDTKAFYQRTIPAGNSLAFGVISLGAAGAFTNANMTDRFAVTITGVTVAGTMTVSGNVGFYGTAAVAKPTGVAVTAAGVHAALVTLGLIAA